MNWDRFLDVAMVYASGLLWALLSWVALTGAPPRTEVLEPSLPMGIMFAIVSVETFRLALRLGRKDDK